jgi:hypothetical protein
MTETTPREFKIRTTELRAYTDGRIERWMKSGRWKVIKNTKNHAQGYNVILIDKKQYMRGRVMGTAFLGIDPENKNMVVFHKDGNRMNTTLSNLSTLSHSQANRAVSERQQNNKQYVVQDVRIDEILNKASPLVIMNNLQTT